MLRIFSLFLLDLPYLASFGPGVFSLGVGSQSSQIILGQFDFSGSFGIFQLRHRRSRRMDRWPCFLGLCKKGLFGFLRSSLVRFWSLPKICGPLACDFRAFLQIAFEPGNFSSFRTSPKIQDSDYVHRMLLCLSLGVFSPDSLSRVKEILGVCSKWFVSCCLVFPFIVVKLHPLFLLIS